MIKYETIISNFDDKTTLYNWLRKVEEALKHASATNFVVNKKGNATLSFSITFADGTTLESGDIVLQQGESVDDARIASGVLQLHLTNGTWLTAGNIKPVSNFEINGSQHLIVNYQDGTSQDLGAIFNGNINISGNITATGTIDGNKVTGNEIVEKMDGYFFLTYVQEKIAKDFVYCGVVKNGNKLTMVCAVNITLDADAGNWCALGSFSFPQAIKDKIYPSTIGNLNAVDVRKILLFDDTLSYASPIEKVAYAEKNASGNIFMQCSLSDVPREKTYYLRYELTLLLSDNLIS